MTGPAAIPGDTDIAVVGLGFGDEGKGATVDWLAAEFDVAAVVRFNGGAQAAHNVALPDGRQHTFRQFGAATLSGIATHLSEFALVEPIALAREAAELAELGVHEPFSLVSVNPEALITTPIHAAANRAREDRRGAARHGSCGLGIGETVRYAQMTKNCQVPKAEALRAGDCGDAATVCRRLDHLARFYAPLLAGTEHGHPSVAELMGTYVAFAEAIRQTTHLPDGRLVFEGAQGILLDEWRGFHPYTTWSTTEPANARCLARRAGRRLHVLGVTRSYATRHGAGPLPSEGTGPAVNERHNAAGAYQGEWRTGAMDFVLAKYACAVARPDGLVVTHLDAISPGQSGVEAYRDGRRWVTDLPLGRHRDLAHQQRLTDLLRRAIPCYRSVPDHPDIFVKELERELGFPVVATADGPARPQRQFRV